MNGSDGDSIAAALARMEAGYDSARKQGQVADAARDAVGSLNAPSWWKASVARFEELERLPETTPPGPKH